MDRLATRHRLFFSLYSPIAVTLLWHVLYTDRPTFLQGCALGSAVRCCVPLFVMMTGVLLFPVRNGMSEFYKKRIGRIVVPLIFWSVIDCLYCISSI